MFGFAPSLDLSTRPYLPHGKDILTEKPPQAGRLTEVFVWLFGGSLGGSGFSLGYRGGLPPRPRATRACWSWLRLLFRGGHQQTERSGFAERRERIRADGGHGGHLNTGEIDRDLCLDVLGWHRLVGNDQAADRSGDGGWLGGHCFLVLLMVGLYCPHTIYGTYYRKSQLMVAKTFYDYDNDARTP